MSKLFFLICLLVVYSTTMMAEPLFLVMLQTAPAITPDFLIAVLMPLLVWLATWFVNWLKTKLGPGGFSGTVLVTFVVPVLSWLSAEIFTYLTNYEGSFWGLFGLGLVGTFVNEMVKQWKQSATNSQTPAKADLIG